MLRKIIKIDTEKCVGCGFCTTACHEGAISLANGKATLLKDDYCDGLGNCLPVCPTKAITFEEREANAYNRDIAPKRVESKSKKNIENEQFQSRLNQWPCQIKLVPINAPYFENADLLIAADCSAYASHNFHDEFMRNKITIIGCPKLDECDYSEKLSTIIKENNIKSITVTRMEVPCCTGIYNAASTALKNSSKSIPFEVITISTDGNLL